MLIMPRENNKQNTLFSFPTNHNNVECAYNRITENPQLSVFHR